MPRDSNSSPTIDSGNSAPSDNWCSSTTRALQQTSWMANLLVPRALRIIGSTSAKVALLIAVFRSALLSTASTAGSSPRVPASSGDLSNHPFPVTISASGSRSRRGRTFVDTTSGTSCRRKRRAWTTVRGDARSCISRGTSSGMTSSSMVALAVLLQISVKTSRAKSHSSTKVRIRFLVSDCSSIWIASMSLLVISPTDFADAAPALGAALPLAVALALLLAAEVAGLLSMRRSSSSYPLRNLLTLLV